MELKPTGKILPMSAGAEIKTCQGCQKLFAGHNIAQLYCTVKCRKKANNVDYVFRKTNGPPKRARMFPDLLALQCMIAHPNLPEAKALRDRLLPVVIKTEEPKVAPQKPAKATPSVLLPARKYPSLASILTRVCEKTGLSETAVRSRSHSQAVCHARQEFYYLAASETLDSCAKIARFVDRDHTTILHGISAYCQRHNLPNPRGSPTNAKLRTRRTMERRLKMRGVVS